MTASQLACAYLAMTCVGAAGFAQVAAGDVGWKDIASGGAASLVIIVVVIFLRTQSEMRREHGETVGQISKDFSEAVKANTREFAESTNKIIEGSRAHNQANLAMLQQILTDLYERK
jgi:hypothetical protein